MTRLDFSFAIMDLLFKVVEVAPSGDRMIATADNLAEGARGVRYGGVAVAWNDDRVAAEGASDAASRDGGAE
jgi:hypothetical protein